jgi:hypothetical protein
MKRCLSSESVEALGWKMLPHVPVAVGIDPEAELRTRTGSPLPAVLAHIGGNVAGLPGGIVGVVICRLVHSHLPHLTGS